MHNLEAMAKAVTSLEAILKAANDYVNEVESYGGSRELVTDFLINRITAELNYHD